MTIEDKISLVKINTMENKYPLFSDMEIRTMLEATDSVAYVSHKIAVLKGDNQAVSIGPISLENNSKFWNNLANLYLMEYEEEKKLLSKEYGGTLYMRRADEVW